MNKKVEECFNKLIKLDGRELAKLLNELDPLMLLSLLTIGMNVLHATMYHFADLAKQERQ